MRREQKAFGVSIDGEKAGYVRTSYVVLSILLAASTIPDPGFALDLLKANTRVEAVRNTLCTFILSLPDN